MQAFWLAFSLCSLQLESRGHVSSPRVCCKRGAAILSNLTVQGDILSQCLLSLLTLAGCDIMKLQSTPPHSIQTTCEQEPGSKDHSICDNMDA